MSETALPMQIGARLRSIRQSSGRSLASVAQQMGISSSALSQIETGAMQPSVNRLIEFVTVLGVPVSAIFDDLAVFSPRLGDGAAEVTEPLEGVLVSQPDAVEAAHLGQGVTYRRLSPAALPGVDWFESTYPPGSSSSIDGAMLVHAGYESGHVVQGELTFEFADGAVRLGRGGSLSFAASRPHRVVNDTAETAVAIWLTLTTAEPS
ncbi:helix-turn-helix domain-containing protein [Microbacterium sp. ARD31]|jgi:transcriptional regulator with XRE-family HTH domain|uniref:helix-turn-helix domain-containing protein n=1 Tax=Microbacterium sp. ARD31 TaxID=2962576 RepID=UPI002880F1FE|nr:helix-turn-helix domain-containing protein [Microbacterium sp. ARD31]MDT0182621.1 helix-turn-helix domain-containing protein [Microbacterium sp. ARD31]